MSLLHGNGYGGFLEELRVVKLSAYSTLQQNEAAAKQKAPFEPKVHIALIDGQPSLWEKIDQLKKEFSEYPWVEILDLMHANSYLWEAAAVFHPGDNKQQLVFMKDRVLRLLQGKVGLVISGLRQMTTKQKIKKSGRAIIKKVCRYFSNNRDRMKYDEYLAAGYSIATGVTGIPRPIKLQLAMQYSQSH